MKAKIEWRAVWTDNDGMLQLAIAASNGSYSGVHETYIYPEDLVSFGEDLKRFPTSLEHEVVLESGSEEPNWHDHLWLRAFVLDSRGHSAIEVKLETRGKPPAGARCEFYIPADPATLNDLGSAIVAWASAPAEPLVVEWTRVEGVF